MKIMLEHMSNGNFDVITNELTSVEYVCEYIYAQYPRTFTEVVNHNGLIIMKRMNDVETAAVLSDVGVTDKN